MKNVLMAIDETAGSKSVLSVYKTMVQEPENVILVHVQRPEGKSLMNDTLSELGWNSENITSFYKRELENGGSVKVKAMVREGIPSKEILKVAHEEKVDMIIMGRNSGPRRFFAGCVTKEVERRATVPVLVAKMAAQ